MTHSYTSYVVRVVAVSALLLPVFASAQGLNVQPAAVGAARTPAVASSHPRAALVASSTAEVTRGAKAKEKAAQEIDRRIKTLTALIARLESLNKVSDVLKSNYKTNMQTTIDNLYALKTKIEDDTDLATLKTDIQSIAQSYRIFMLVMPQAHISIASDRTATLINMMSTSGNKLQARVNSAKQAGNDTKVADDALLDLAAKLTSAQAHALEAINVSAPLVPDNGDKTAMEANNAALAKARDELKAAQTDLVAGRKDIETILKALKGMKPAASASASSTQTQQ